MPTPPAVEPTDAPTRCVELNETWLSWLQGRVIRQEWYDWWEGESEDAANRSRVLADILANGNCDVSSLPVTVYKRINLGSDLLLNSATRVSMGSPFDLTLSPTEPSRYMISLYARLKNNNASARNIFFYLDLPGQLYYLDQPIASVFVPGSSNAWVSFNFPTGTHNPPTIAVDFQYQASGAGVRINQTIGSLPNMSVISATPIGFSA